MVNKRRADDGDHRITITDSTIVDSDIGHGARHGSVRVTSGSLSAVLAALIEKLDAVPIGDDLAGPVLNIKEEVNVVREAVRGEDVELERKRNALLEIQQIAKGTTSSPFGTAIADLATSALPLL